MIYPRQIKAARTLLGISQTELAERVGISPATIKRIEARADELSFKVDTMVRIQQSLEEDGIVFIDADENLGLGVRLKNPLAR